MWLVKQVARRSRRSDWRGYFLIGCVALLALMLAGASYSAFRSAQERATAEAWQDHTLRVLLETDRLRAGALQQIRGERGFLLTGDETFLRPYWEGRKQSQESFDMLSTLIRDNAEQQSRMGRLEGELAQLNDVLSAMIAQQQNGQHDLAIFYVKKGNGRNAIEKIIRELDAIEATERELLAERTALAKERAASNERYQYILALVGVALLMLAVISTFYVRRALGAESEARRELQRFASTDALTGLANRRSFMEALERSLARAQSDPQRQLCLAIFDIDHFKRINDRFGHPAGDEVIREVATRANEALRKRDVLGRIGGEEFAVILPKADLETASIACERLRAELAAKPLRYKDAIIPFTTSVGIAQFAVGDDVDHLMARADAALYDAKTGGRNQIRLAA